MATMARCSLLLALVGGTAAELQLAVYNTTAFGGPLASNGTTSGGIAGPTSVGCNQSAEYVGTLTAPPGASLLAFAAEVDADASTLRVWVAEFLVLEANTASKRWQGGKVAGLLALPPNILAENPMPIRVHYARICSGGAGSLSLRWGASAGSNMTVVPPDAFSPVLSDAQQAREAMRARLYEPVIPWQTYVHSSMGAHTLQPSGLVVRLGIADLAGGSDSGGGNEGHVAPELLGDTGYLAAWHRFVPAHLRPGRHSLNGSDYTSLEVSGWGKGASTPVKNAPMSRRNATLVLETTTLTADGQLCVGAEGERCDLLALVSCSGTDCASLALTLSGTFEWGRGGGVALFDGDGKPDLHFTGVGFPAVTAFACADCHGTDISSASQQQAPIRFLKIGKDGGAAAVSTGARRTLAEISAAVSAAKIRANVLPERLAHVADLALPMFDVLAWNTLFTTSLHVYTPVSRTFGNIGSDDAATTFVWDVFFAAVMFGLAGPEHASSLRARDIAYANIITTVFSRTVTGMVPNYRNGQGGQTCTYDRTEPMVGSWSLQILHSVFGDDWPVQLLFPALLGWNQWVWDARTAEGSLGVGHSGGKTALISLGSDGPPKVPLGLNTPHTLSAARYESGLDNSPQYDGPLDGNEGYGLGPVWFNNTTNHMELYDVAFTAYHARDGQALVEMSGAAGTAGSAKVTALEKRLATTEAALHRDLFDNSTGLYANRLYNGSFYRRWAPTVFSPMLLNSTGAAHGGIAGSGTDRVEKMMELMGDPATFCVASPLPKQPLFLWRMSATGGAFLRKGQSITCASAECLRDSVLGSSDFVALEALVEPSQTADAPVPLFRYRTKQQVGDLCLSSNAPASGYTRTNASAPAEGWCSATRTSVYTQQLVLWYSAKLSAHQTCGGGKGCNSSEMQAAGYERVKTLCYARSATNPKDLPCRYGLPSIHRSDDAFWDQIYWRGRIWAPQIYLVYAGLANFADVPAVKTKKAELANQARRLFTQEYELFGQINENTNGVLGVGSDSDRADGYYHWGALHALVAIAEEGAYPSPML